MSTSPVPNAASMVFPPSREKWHIYNPDELKQRCRQLPSGSLIEGLVPRQTIGIIVGDSGVGKSPLLYQAAVCVAAGIPFLGNVVSQGRVLYLDFENGLQQVHDLIFGLARYVGLQDVPRQLLTWNYHDSTPDWKASSLKKMVDEIEPAWIIIDSLSEFVPAAEEKPSVATNVYKTLRRIIREYPVSFTVVHHLRKQSYRRNETPPPLQEHPYDWFLQARGSRALINGCDVRIGIDGFNKTGEMTTVNGRPVEVAAVLAGFSRVRGKFPPLYLARAVDDDGAPLGYERLSGVNLLFNSEQEQAFHRLSTTFRFKEAHLIYGKGAQATTDFLKKCLSIKILRKIGIMYLKVETTAK